MIIEQCLQISLDQLANSRQVADGDGGNDGDNNGDDGGDVDDDNGGEDEMEQKCG